MRNRVQINERRAEALCYLYAIFIGTLVPNRITALRMTFFSVLLALIIEQLRALSPHNPVSMLFHYHATSAGQAFDAGKRKHGLLAWLSVAVPWTLAVALIYYLLYRISFVLAFLWNVVVVYLTLGFRQFSHYFTDIHLALNNDDVPRAREILAQWTGLDTVDMPVTEIVRHTLIRAVIASHRHVFGVFFWFVVPIGPAGAVLYRVAEHLARTWNDTVSERTPAFAAFARQAFFLIDWMPARLTAMGFAIVGNFEDAIYAWRNTAQQWPDSNEGVLLSAGSGALGARLAGPLAEPSSVDALSSTDGGPVPVGEDCTPRALQSAVGLVWRAVILWMLLLLMLTVAVWAG